MNTNRKELDLLKAGNLELQSEAVQLQKELNILCAGQAAVNTVDGPAETDGQIDVKILREKCKRMQTEIKIMDSAPLQALPSDVGLRLEVLYEDLRQRIQQMHECLKYVEAQEKETEEDLEREIKTCEELTSAIQISRVKLAETAGNKDSQTDIHAQLERKCELLDRDNQQKLKEMISFLDEHFPLPDAETFNKVKKKVETSEGQKLTSLRDLHTLRSILEVLINKSLDCPNDPYVTIDQRYWPPYVELLLQCDLAVRHPADSRRMKLMPFHM